MCILLSSVLHPDYPLILISNRDEYFSRKTQHAAFHQDNPSLLYPKDLARQEHGTWIGINKNGKIAVLLNYREPKLGDCVGKISRGAIPIEFLQSDLAPEKWEHEIGSQTETLQDIGGFSLLFGKVNVDRSTNGAQPLRIFSNRSNACESAFNTYKTIGMSNSKYHEPWPKVHVGTELLEKCVKSSVDENWSQEQLIEQLFAILSTAIPEREKWKDMSYNDAFDLLPNSIFIPPVWSDAANDYYGTRTHTIIMLNKNGQVTYIERDLHTSRNLDEAPQTRKYEFSLENDDT
ncbi:hypothetical protein OGAPHI_000122 [Ogataea philodendri]|uniref:Transport and Golgi organization protein 2 n=1 Tax=Ogataea philodendri TaxID=1378263 RepID=A0A9P8PH88_9ASCO|nr:uncharacterized protein OGAPHI_000122 [Ogataea philodendri]KAH3671936.1 hypothetical protein OGAPHI_000122 [Ogataea philodendri]